MNLCLRSRKRHRPDVGPRRLDWPRVPRGGFSTPPRIVPSCAHYIASSMHPRIINSAHREKSVWAVSEPYASLPNFLSVRAKPSKKLPPDKAAVGQALHNLLAIRPGQYADVANHKHRHMLANPAAQSNIHRARGTLPPKNKPSD
jgi:hypothetical protein